MISFLLSLLSIIYFSGVVIITTFLVLKAKLSNAVYGGKDSVLWSSLRIGLTWPAIALSELRR